MKDAPYGIDVRKSNPLEAAWAHGPKGPGRDVTSPFITVSYGKLDKNQHKNVRSI
jgi:hypothetical protein